MPFTLVASRNPGGVVLEKCPAVLSVGSDGAIHPDDSVAGAYRCLITQVDDHLVVHDLGSRGGTFVNGVRVTNASLKPGDRLSLNGSDFVVDGHPRPKRYLHGVRS